MGSEEIIQIGQQSYVPATSSRLDDRTRVLKHGDTFAVFDRYGDIHALGHSEQGIYHQDTRFLSKLDLRLADGRRPVLLNSTIKQDNSLLTVDLTIPEIYQDDQLIVPLDTIHVFRAKLIYNNVCHEHLRLTNYGSTCVTISFVLKFDADFSDIFEVRGKKRAERGQREPARILDQGVTLSYTGLDDITRHTYIDIVNAGADITENEAHFSITLEPADEKDIYIAIYCDFDNKIPPAADYLEALNLLSAEIKASRHQDSVIHASNEQFNDWLNRSMVDLHLLTSHTKHGSYPYAGVPWFSTAFGRDGIITALQYLWVNPDLGKGVLAYLAANQAHNIDPESEAEPGKILHETRGGEMATLGEVPFKQYYGTIDATPLFVVLAGEYYQQTGNLDFIKSIWTNIEDALNWIDCYGDRDGDGFIEYESQNEKGLSQQGWKDSDDSVFHQDGRPAHGAIALCEVQGYVYDAWIRASQFYQLFGHSDKSNHYQQKADTLKKRFNEVFWCDDIGTYALALDGDKTPCRVRSSNAGHTLYSGIANEGYARQVAKTLLADDSFSGWGIRTIAKSERRYNPMSYHNGAVWPHDNAIIAMGFARYGLNQETEKLLSGHFEASMFLDLGRMPELFCGFVKRDGEGPTLYPLACAPQAWASTVIFAMLKACLQMRVEHNERPQLLFCKPHLPVWLDHLKITSLRVGQGSVDIMVQRYETDVGINVLRREGNVKVTVVK